MINIKLPPIKDKDVTNTSITTKESNNVVKNIADEARRRDKIVQQLYQECSFRKGDTAFPSDEKIANIIGTKLIVLAIAKSYSDLGKGTKWPAGDNPLMVDVKSYDKDTVFCVTTNSLVKREPQS